MKFELGMMYEFESEGGLWVQLYHHNLIADIPPKSEYIHFQEPFMIVAVDYEIVVDKPNEFVALKVLGKDFIGWIYLNMSELEILKKIDENHRVND